MVYVLDEPSAGLHPADAEPLMDVLEQLKKSGNSLFIVEHDMDVVRRADWVVDIGPGAGSAGGRVLYSGPVEGLENIEESPTSRHLFGRAPVAQRRPRSPEGWIHLRGVSRHNLHNVSVDVPLCVLTAVTGVSGSGKSTLVTQVLAELVRRHLGLALEAGDEELSLEVTEVSGLESFDRLVSVDQRPIGRTPRSTWLPTPDCSTRFASCSRRAMKLGLVGIRRGDSRSTSRRDVAKRAWAKASLRSNCCFYREPMRRVLPVTARGTTPTPFRLPTGVRTLPTSWR